LPSVSAQPEQTINLESQWQCPRCQQVNNQSNRLCSNCFAKRPT
jgi:membrane protease subunit (stomatin/prohibitin family)